MSDAPDRQLIVDEEHLKLLAVCYMISAAISGFFSLIGLMYMGMGAAVTAAIMHAPELSANTNGGPPATLIGWIFGAIGFAFFLASITIAGLKLGVALCLKNRKSRTFCMVVAAIGCLEIPYGTILSVFTFLVLGRDSVTRLFGTSLAPKSVG